MFGFIFRDLEQLYAIAIDQRDAYYLKVMQSKVGSVPDWMICAEFIGGFIRNNARYKREMCYEELKEHILEEIILSGSSLSKSSIDKEELDEESRRDRKIDEAKKEIGEEALNGAIVLSEIIASNIIGQGAMQDRRKSHVFVRSSEFKLRGK